MEEMCPGLPDWKALDACAAKLATAETGGKGRFVGPPADWGKHYSERIQALKMNFQEVPVGQAATLWAELQAAYDRKEPVVLFNWTPNFIEAKFEGKFVEFPAYEPACFTDPKWGSNPDAIYDCGAPAKGYLKKAGSKQLGEKWPMATEILKKVNFTNAQIAAAAAMVDVEGMTPEDAATKWVKENEATWKTWVQ
jgi:glycine betaine/proline transport system substrate-binding protein